jgi:hypothetical protein
VQREERRCEHVLGPDLFVVVLVLVASLLLPLWAIVDALSRPAVAFFAAGSNKAAWVLVLLAATVFGLGFPLAAFYLLSVRRQVRLQAQFAVSR